MLMYKLYLIVRYQCLNFIICMGCSQLMLLKLNQFHEHKQTTETSTPQKQTSDKNDKNATEHESTESNDKIQTSNDHNSVETGKS